MSVELAIEGGEPAVVGPPERKWPYIEADDMAAVLEVLMGAPEDLGGPYSRHNRALEEEIAAFVGAEHCISVPSATDGLYMSLLVHGIKPGDRVIVPALTWISTASVVLELGAKLDFCDIDPVTFNLDLTKAADLVTPDTSALMLVHTHGLAADMTAARAFCKEHDLVCIEDAAQAFGSSFGGRMVGTFGETGVYSHNAKKPLTAGDGGTVVTNSAAVYEALQTYCNYGLTPRGPAPSGYTADNSADWLGSNRRLQPMAAGLLRSQLRKFPRFLENAWEVDRILQPIGELPGFQPPHIPGDRTSSHHLWRVMLDPVVLDWRGSLTELRDRIIWALRAEGVPAGTWWLEPMDRMKAFRRIRPSYRTIHSTDVALTKPIDPLAMPVTTRVLDGSIVLGRTPETFQVLSPSRAKRYKRAFEKISDRMAVVLTADYEPLRRHPPVSEISWAG